MHDRVSGDQPFLRALALIERGAADDRHFVSKAGGQHGGCARRESAAPRSMRPRSRPLSDWLHRPTLRHGGSGQHALRELTGAPVKRRLAAKREQ